MKLECTGTGYINSQIIVDKIVKGNNEEIPTCYFQFANYKYTDKNNNKIYSYFLCQAIGNIAKLIIENFTKGHKVFIKGEFEQKSIKRKNDEKQYNNVTIIQINWIEFMNKSNDLEIKEDEKDSNIEETLQNEKILNLNKDNNAEAFS